MLRNKPVQKKKVTSDSNQNQFLEQAKQESHKSKDELMRETNAIEGKLVAISEVDMMSALIDERNEAIDEIHDDLVVVHGLFTKVAKMVEDARPKVKIINENCVTAGDNTLDAYKNLVKANEYQKGNLLFGLFGSSPSSSSSNTSTSTITTPPNKTTSSANSSLNGSPNTKSNGVFSWIVGSQSPDKK